MRKLRSAIAGLVLALPAALVLPGAAPVGAATTCPGTNFGSFNATIESATLHGSGSGVAIDGSGFALATSFSNGGTVYFPNSSGSQTVPDTSWSSQNSGNTVVVSAPSGYSGTLEICLNTVGGSYTAFTTNRYSFVPQVDSVPASASEGSTVTLGGKFMKGQPTSVRFGCGGVVTGSAISSTQVTATVPGYCPGPLSVTQTSYDNQSLGSPATGSLKIQPTASDPSTSSTYPGQNVTVTGSGFGGGGSVTVGGTPANVVSWSDGQITFQAPDGSEGGPVVITAPGGSVSAGSVRIAPHISGISPSTAKDGDTVTISGKDFAGPGTVSLNGQPLPASDISNWAMDQITFVVPGGAQPGPVAVTAGWPDNPTVSGPSLGLAPVISSVTPTQAAAGSYVTISGSTFGQNPGSVTIGGKPAQIADWADTAIIAVVPSGASSGQLVVNSGYGSSVAWSRAFTVLPGGSAAPAGSTGTYTNSGTMNVTPNYGFLTLPKAPPGVAFHITAPSTSVKPGALIDLTVNLQINGKAVAGATITFQVASSPGSGTQLSAPSAVTDQNGVAHVTLATSKKPGQTIVIAHSGAFADEIRILTISPTAAVGGLGTTILRTTSTLDPHILFPFIGALVLAVLLLLGTVILQFVVHRRSRIPVPAAAPVPAIAGTEAPAERLVAAAPKPRKPRAPRVKKPVLRTIAPAEQAEPIPLGLAAGAEDIASVIPLRPVDQAPEAKITRTRARAKPRE